MPTKNYVYGAKAPNLEQAVSDAIYEAHRYRNKLCELELAKRERHEALLQKLAPKYVACCTAVEASEAALGETREAIQAERVKQRTKKPTGVEHLTERAKRLKATLKEQRAARKAAKQSAYQRDEVKAAMDANQEQHKAAMKAARQASPLYWPTKGYVADSCRSFSSGAPPRFRRFDGEGGLALQLQGGLSTSSILSGDTRLYIEADPELQRKLAEEGKAPKGDQGASCYFRIGSEGRDPIFAKLPFQFHRPLPTGQIKWAYLERQKMANKDRWQLRLTIDCEAREPPEDSSRWCAVCLGWARCAGGLRVARWRAHDGESGEIVLPPSHLADQDELDAIRAERDVRFDRMTDQLRDWLAGREDLPERLVETRKHLAKWKSPARLSALATWWADHRQPGDERIYAWLRAWQQRDKKRWQHSARLRKRISRRRKNAYRVFAARLAEQYSVLYHAALDVAELTENLPPEELAKAENALHRQSRQAAPGLLGDLLREKFPLRAITVASENLARECPHCGSIADQNRQKMQCRQCSRTYTRRDATMRNLIARGEAARESGALLELETAQRVARAKAAERLAKMQAGARAARKQAASASGAKSLG